MKLSAPAYRLKRHARKLSRKENIPLHAALDRVAQEEGFTGWSLLAARLSAEGPAEKLFTRLNPGELVLLGARPGHGKTLMGVELILESLSSGRQGWFFTLEWNEVDFLNIVREIGINPSSISELFKFDSSSCISADYIIKRLNGAASGTVVVIDYLQLLDQKREHPELAVQVSSLKAFARDCGLIVVFLSQIDRSYNAQNSAVPCLADVRLPNQLDLTLFDRSCFLNNGVVQTSMIK